MRPRSHPARALDIAKDPAELTADLIDIPSPSREEGHLADLVEQALSQLGRFEVLRVGNAVLARTHLGRPSRVVIAGHLDTVPIADNVPSHRSDGGETIHGCGATDMKSGDAVFLHLAANVPNPSKDLTFIFYDCEELSHDENGLTRIEAEYPQWLIGDLAILGEPTNGAVEAGCQGSLSFRFHLTGARAHAARSWLGENAIHKIAPIAQRFADYRPRTVDVDGCEYREGLNMVGVSGGIANNVIPDACEIRGNFRYAPDRTPDDARAHIHEVFDEFDVTITDLAPAAAPGLDAPAAAEFVAAAGGEAFAKYGWTDVARFAALGIPAVNYGPGDSGMAHTPGEYVHVQQIREMTAVLRGFIS